MRLDLSIGGHPRQWRCVGAARVERWLAGGPWSEQGGVLLVQTPSSELEVILEGLERSYKAVAGPRARWVRAWWDDAPRDLAEALRACLGLRGATRRLLVASLCEQAELEPSLSVLVLPDGASPSAWVDEAQQLVEISTKSPRGVPLAFLLASTATGGGERLDLAWPIDLGCSGLRHALWADYLHERVAWHVAGKVEMAMQVAARMGGGMQQGDERLLELRLDEDAAKRWAAVHASTRAALAGGLAELARHPSLRAPQGLPGPGGKGRPAAWVARALLREHPRHPMRRQLRAAMACRPLAMRLLGRCMDMEARVLDALLEPPLGSPAPVEAHHQFGRFWREPGSLERRVTPPGSPLPDDPWELAGLGALVRAAGVARWPASIVHDLRRLRNVMAHGGAVGWEAVLTVERIDSRLR